MSTVVSFKPAGGSRRGGRITGPAMRRGGGKMGPRKAASVVSRAISGSSRAASKNGSAMSRTSTKKKANVNSAIGAANMNVTAVKACAYWDALTHTVPPSLTTTYGAYTCVNSVVRFTYTTQANQNVQFMFLWNPTPNRTFVYSQALSLPVIAGTWAQQQLLAAINTAPLDLRPLRMSVRACNTTAAINRGGSVTSALVPQSILQSYGGINSMSAASWASQWGLAQNSPHSRRLSAEELARPHAFVMPPSSYLAYNSYADYVSTSSDNGSVISSADFSGLMLGDPNTIISVFPFVPKFHFAGAIPTNNILLVNIEPNPLPQTYDFVVSCQDAVRYPANSLPASMAQKYEGHLSSDLLAQHTASVATASNVHPNDSISQVGTTVGGLLGARLGAVAGGNFGPAGAAAGNYVGGMMGSQLGGYMGSRFQ